jgi:hypothetical protein
VDNMTCLSVNRTKLRSFLSGHGEFDYNSQH